MTITVEELVSRLNYLVQQQPSIATAQVKFMHIEEEEDDGEMYNTEIEEPLTGIRYKGAQRHRVVFS